MPHHRQDAPQSAQDGQGRVQIHTTTFARNTRTGLWRASCVCGWVKFGEREEVQSRAANHDLDWIAADPTDTPPFWTETQR